MSLSLTFLGGRKRTITIAATAGNVVSNQTPGTGKRWLILGGRIKLIADANAGNRYVGFLLTDGTNVLQGLGYVTTAVTASQTRYVTLGTAPSVVGSNWSFQGTEIGGTGIDVGRAALPFPLIVEGANQFRVVIEGGLAGDSFSGFLDVLEIDI